MLVEFDRDGYTGAFDQFMGLKEALERILGKPVDLITAKQFRNPLFQEELIESMIEAYFHDNKEIRCQRSLLDRQSSSRRNKQRLCSKSKSLKI